MAHNKWGFVDKNNRMVIQPQFDQLSAFSEGLAIVCKERKYGYINRAGQTVIAMQFDDAYPFSGECALIRKGDKFGIINKLGKYVIEPQFNGFKILSEGVTLFDSWSMPPYDVHTRKFAVKTAGNYVVFDKVAYKTSNPSFHVYVDGFGSITVNPAEEHISFLYPFHEGLARFTSGQLLVQSGFIDKTGKVAIPAQYESASEFHEGLAAVGHEPHSSSESM